MKYSLITLLVIIAFAFSSQAQDKIFRNNGKTVLAKVIEVGSSEIRYREFENPDGPVYILEADRILRIEYENGKIETFGRSNSEEGERYATDLNKILKVNFFSPLYGYTEIGYEKSIGVGKSIEFSLGVIGLGKSSELSYWNGSFYEEPALKPRGAFVTAGYKFNKLPDFLLFGRTRMSHLMQGTYLKPTVYLGHYSERYLLQKQNSNVQEVRRQNVSFGALQLEMGKQWIFEGRVALNFFWGLGYGFDNKNDRYQYEDNRYGSTGAWNYANARAGESPGLSATFGIKLGLLLK